MMTEELRATTEQVLTRALKSATDLGLLEEFISVGPRYHAESFIRNCPIPAVRAELEKHVSEIEQIVAAMHGMM